MDRNRKLPRTHIWLPLLGAAAFAANVVIGKYGISTGQALPHLKDAGQFVLLALTIAAFTRSILVAELRRDAAAAMDPEQGEREGQET